MINSIAALMFVSVSFQVTPDQGMQNSYAKISAKLEHVAVTYQPLSPITPEPKQQFGLLSPIVFRCVLINKPKRIPEGAITLELVTPTQSYVPIRDIVRMYKPLPEYQIVAVVR